MYILGSSLVTLCNRQHSTRTSLGYTLPFPDGPKKKVYNFLMYIKYIVYHSYSVLYDYIYTAI